VKSNKYLDFNYNEENVMKKSLLVSGVIILGLIGIVVVWWLVSPLFISQSVDEGFHFELPEESEIADLSPDEAEQVLEDAMNVINEEFVENILPEQAEALEEKIMAVATVMPDHPMEEEMPEANTESEWVLVSQGQFQDADNLHQSSGTASIFQQGDQHVMRFEEFAVTNGPDLHVLLVENIAATNHEAIGNYVDLGSLKGNMGNQNYEIMADVDLAQYVGVMIYCVPFHVVFAIAPFGN
jgi:hypothetical protein